MLHGTKENNSKRRKGSARKNGVVEFWDECTCFVDNWLDLVSELIRLGVETFVASFRKGRSLVGIRPFLGWVVRVYFSPKGVNYSPNPPIVWINEVYL